MCTGAAGTATLELVAGICAAVGSGAPALLIQQHLPVVLLDELHISCHAVLGNLSTAGQRWQPALGKARPLCCQPRASTLASTRAAGSRCRGTPASLRRQGPAALVLLAPCRALAACGPKPAPADAHMGRVPCQAPTRTQAACPAWQQHSPQVARLAGMRVLAAGDTGVQRKTQAQCLN